MDRDGQPNVWVLAYQPEFSPERQLWFVDIAFDPGTAFWPFVKLAVARYQQHRARQDAAIDVALHRAAQPLCQVRHESLARRRRDR